MNGNNLDWAKYVVYCDKYVTNLREIKATNFVQQLELGGVHEVK
jgi:hypothetical protein